MQLFSIQKLATDLKTLLEIDFALLFGSAQSGILEKKSDIDIGVYLNTPVTPDLIDNKIEEYADFYSLTCREYEDTMAWMQRQMVYRGYA